MESTSTILQVLSDLLKINRDRVEGYKKASHDTHDPGLKALFRNMSDQGQKNVTDILQEIINHNGSTESAEITTAGKLYKTWTNFKTKFLVNSIKNVLTSCESREKAALQIYRKAKNKSLTVQLTDLIKRHELLLQSSHEVIRVYRQAYTKVGQLHS
jgi:uncharacterized protein (TIGR02284 family)